MDFPTLLETLSVGMFPWISQFRQLDFHYTISDFHLKSSYNFFASLFGSSIFIYLSRLGAYDLLYWPNWWWFIIGAFGLTLGYFAILIFTREKVGSGKGRGFIFLNFFIYVAIFCALTTGFGILKMYSDYYKITGVVRTENGEPLGGAILTLSYRDNTESDLMTETQTNGKFAFLIQKDISGNYNKMKIERPSYQLRQKQFGNIASLRTIVDEISLKKLSNP